MSEFFAQCRMTLLLRLVSAASFVIFLGVIALNYHAIGQVQELNEALLNGPLAVRDSWRLVSTSLGDVENLRLKFLIMPQSERAVPVRDVLGQINAKAGSLAGGAASAVQEAVGHYTTAFNNVVSAALGNLEARKQLLKDREAIETLIYDLDSRTLETALGEFILAEVGYFAEQGGAGPEKGKSVRVLLDRFLRDTAAVANAEAFRVALTEYRKRFDGIVENNASIVRLSEAMEKTAEEIRQSVREGLNAANSAADVASENARLQAQWAQRAALWWTAVGVVFAFLLSLLFERALQRRISHLLEFIGRLAQGDLRLRFAVTGQEKNELYQIMSEINRMADGLSRLLLLLVGRSKSLSGIVEEFMQLKDSLMEHAGTGNQKVNQVTTKNDQVDASSHTVYKMSEDNEQEALKAKDIAREFAGIVHTVAAATEEASVNVTTMAGAAEQMSSNVAEVNHNLEQVSHSVASVAVAVQELDASLEQTRKQCRLADEKSHRASNQVVEAQHHLTKLSESAREIGKVVEMIKQIADQTNMLALNAGIEAAGAGEAGRGFAVVANEVKELARGTREATQLIAQRVAEIQGVAKTVGQSIGEVVEGIGMVQEITGEITHAVEEQTRSSREIAGSMGRVTQATTAVTQNAHELAKAASEVARAAAEAAQGTGEVARSTGQAAVRAEYLVNHSSELHGRSLEMKEKSRHIFAASGEVQKVGLEIYDIMHRLHAAAGNVATLAAQLDEGASSLLSSTQGFVLP